MAAADLGSLEIDCSIFVEKVHFPGDVVVTGTGLQNEFVVHGNILSYASEPLRGILTQPQNDDKKKDGKKMTFELPANVNNKIAVKFFILIYKQTIVNFDGDANMDSLDIKELKILFELSDMYLFDPAKNLIKQNLKKLVKKLCPNKKYEDIMGTLEEEAKQNLVNLLTFSMMLNLQFENFNLVDVLFTAYISETDTRDWDLKMFEYVASQRGGDFNYMEWGGWFFRELIKCVHYTKDLTWKEGTKNISFKPTSKTRIGTFIEGIKEHPDMKDWHNEVYLDHELIRNVFMTINILEK